ncbi:hypothetical protein O181_028869 [Austropuccinia psidii MF-1]|uniref:Integrase zinc-binding domain-containing protein n=1 Tax=Austropuccinia psidii MF-1 TaxID=1389203 RepID=A0A9Q3CRG9_9BASI|nr:hypothetical protein [Austropuccinia psidii MF-1]
MTLCIRLLINTILHECHNSIYSGHLSEDRRLAKVKNCAQWPSWRKETIEYCNACDRCQKANRSTSKEFGLMIHIQEQKSPWEVVHMNWVTALPPSGEKSYNTCLVIVERYSKTPIFLPCHKDDTAVHTALLLWSRVISLTGLLINIKSDTDPKFTYALWTNLHRLFGTKKFCAYGSEFKDLDGFTHDWCTLIPGLELAYKTSVYSFTGQTPDILEKGWNPRIPEDTLRKEFIHIHPTDSSFKKMLDKVKHHAKQSMNEVFDYEKPKWDKIHKVPDFKVGDLVLVSALNFNNIKGPKKHKYSYMKDLFLIKPYQPADKGLFPLRNPTPLTVPPVEQSEDKKIKKVIKERRVRGKFQIEYLVRYRNPVYEDEWLAESEIPDSEKLLKGFRHERWRQA